MGKINVLKVIIGGLVAGVVLSIVDVVLYGVLVKAPMSVAMQKLPPMTDAWRAAEIPWYIFLDFVTGIVLVWLYATMRPRFGAGPGTAAIAGLAGWFFAGLLCNLITLPIGVMLIEYPLAVVIGAKLYTENGGREVAA